MSDRPSSATNSTDDGALDVLIVGAGFCGLYLLDRLRGSGFRVKIIDAGATLGGVWHWNCYPGARVDSACWIYQFPHESLWREWNWSELYPGYEEIRAYFQYADSKLDLSRDIYFETRMHAADFDEERRQWQVQGTDRNGQDIAFRARYVVMCTGSSSKPHIPDIDGLDSFRGPCHHSALWPQSGVQFKDKRVGVIGTGASGVQVAQEASREAAGLTVFQRTPNLCLPMRQRKLDTTDNELARQTYPELFQTRLQTWGGIEYDIDAKLSTEVSVAERTAHFEALWQAGGFRYWIGNYADVLMDETINRVTYDFWRDKVRERITEPAVAEKLAPTVPPHPFGTKRVSLEQWYFDLFNQDNVELIDIKRTPIETVTENGVRVDGRDIPLDVLVLATGFDAVTGGLTQIDIRDGAGVALREKWAKGVRTYQGLTNAGYPNLFMTYGPQAPTAFINGPTCAELQGDFIVQTLEALRERGHTRIEPTQEAEEGWRKLCQELAAPTLFPQADSWYMAANVPGKVREMLMYAGGVPAYRDILNNCAADGYVGYELT
ncbi:MAG: cation diffusion facilitator CzcD-associated flavoprotein CzcO [Gammaproteobacteria bacterium]|jgi:cation diffusion facilitator CzcD-associated flavoprotein CzcO